MENTQMQKELKKLEKPFQITSVCRADIVEQELMTRKEALKLTDWEMEKIASQISEGIMSNFWEALEVIISNILRNKIMEKRTCNTREEAREYAKVWQQWASEQSLSYGEIAEWQEIFRELADKFELVEEFKENGII